VTAAAPAPRIGVLINEVEGGFQTLVINGLRNKAQQHGCCSFPATDSIPRMDSNGSST
jgi:hypothetical protein